MARDSYRVTIAGGIPLVANANFANLVLTIVRARTDRPTATLWVRHSATPGEVIELSPELTPTRFLNGAPFPASIDDDHWVHRLISTINNT